MRYEVGASSIKIIKGSATTATGLPSDEVVVVDPRVPDFSKNPGLCVSHGLDNAKQLTKLIAASGIGTGKVKPNRHERRKQASLAKKKKGKSP